jgi:hypothetical protein
MSIVKSQYITNLNGQVIVPRQGNIIQVNYARTDARTSYVYNYGVVENNTNIHPLTLTLNNVENANHWVLCNWYLTAEQNDSNCILTVLRNGSLISKTGSSGGGAGGGPSYYVGDQGTWYDTDEASTPRSIKFSYIGKIGMIGNVSYQLSIKNSSATAATFFQNRSVVNAGQDAYEIGVSCGVIYEISSYDGWN